MKKGKIFSTKMIALTAVFAALTAIFSQISIPIPISPVPFSLGLAAVFLCGGILTPVYAFSSMTVYLLIGALGLPVFSSFGGGLGHIAGPTGGYLLSYPLVALFISLTLKYFKKSNFLILIASTLVSLLICYAIGTVWLSVYLEKSLVSALMLGVLPYILFDIVKALVCSFITISVKKRINTISI